MTKPKCCLPEQLVEITRSTLFDRYALRPGEDTRKLVGYLHAKSMVDNDQEPCVMTTLSTHFHSLQFDRPGHRSMQMQQFHSNLARKRNKQLGLSGFFFGPEAPGDMVILDSATAIDRILYVVLQPVKDGLVEHFDEWTGFTYTHRDWGKTLVFERPEGFGDSMPERVEITPMPPPGLRHLPLDELIALIDHLVAEEERKIAEARNGRPVVGIEVCEAISPLYIPPPKDKGGFNPKYTGRDNIRLANAIDAHKRFESDHRICSNQWAMGDRELLFPSGTLKMKQAFGVQCRQHSDCDARMTSTVWDPELDILWSTWTQSGQADWAWRRRRQTPPNATKPVEEPVRYSGERMLSG